ncbi:MAG: helix-turn-helix domain-containing protein [Rhodospirillaceae bacterium]|nr:helix-turn-helix domain-containing protein [Rhodospirillaceae bacterium]
MRPSIKEAITETVVDLYEGGFLTKAQLAKYKGLGLTKPQPLSPARVKRIRAKQGISQAVMAHYLGVTKSTVAQWEQGAKKPSGPSLKLLAILDKNGLSGLL